jgi:5-methylthioadenosine/S-adenosylhomocysteine deaminase
MDKTRAIIPNGVIEIKDDKISHVGKDFSGAFSDTAAITVDATRKLVMPGLINGHTHLCMTFAKTICFDINLLDWINKIQYPLMDELGERGFYLAAMIGCIENLKNGNTTVVENHVSIYKGLVSADAPSIKAYKDTGLRGFLARSYADQNYYATSVEKREEIVARCRGLIQEHNNTLNGKLRILIGPVLPWACSKGMFQKTVQLAEELDIGLHMHASENADWNVWGKEVHGSPTNVGVFKKYKCLGPKTSVAAMRVVSDEDIAMLAETKTGLILDPAAALNRGTGLAPISKIRSAGVRVGLGTNGVGQNMFETMKAAGWVARTVDGSPNALPVNVPLEMATIKNAEILGIDNQVGSIEVGKKADLITVNLNKCSLTPCLNVLSATVHSASGSDVEEVIVDGKLLLKEGNLVGLDEASIIEEANERALFCAKKAGLDYRMLPLS